ncbi:MAG: hypothetical protein AAF202_12345 [Pseudomonadota bacterium]
MAKLMIIAIILSCSSSFVSAETAIKKVEESNQTTSMDTFRESLTARSSTVEICNFSNSSASLRACNDRLSTMSLLSNERVQITGQCRSSSSSIYCTDLTALVTVFEAEKN